MADLEQSVKSFITIHGFLPRRYCVDEKALRLSILMMYKGKKKVRISSFCSNKDIQVLKENISKISPICSVSKIGNSFYLIKKDHSTKKSKDKPVLFDIDKLA